MPPPELSMLSLATRLVESGDFEDLHHVASLSQLYADAKIISADWLRMRSLLLLFVQTVSCDDEHKVSRWEDMAKALLAAQERP